MQINKDQNHLMSEYLQAVETTLRKNVSLVSSQDVVKTAQWLIGKEELELFYAQQPGGRMTIAVAAAAATLNIANITAGHAQDTNQAIAANVAAFVATAYAAEAYAQAEAAAHAAPAANASGNLDIGGHSLSVNQTHVKGLNVYELIDIRLTYM